VTKELELPSRGEKDMKLARWKTVAGGAFLAAVLSLPAWGADINSGRQRTASPGTLNYVEGQAAIGDQTLDSKSVGSAQLENGQVLTTQTGKAELLLTPGVYLRLGSNSSVRMVSTGLANTQVELDQGHAMMEVDQIYPQNDIRVSQTGASTRVMKTGLYDFDAANHAVRVFDGKADVFVGDHETTVKGGHEVELNDSGKLKAQGFKKEAVAQNDDLYRWSSLRSEYLSEANIDTARLYYANGWYGPGVWGAGFWGPGWYWDPWFAGFTFIPGGGFFYNPFGWGFYSPWLVYRAPYVAGGYHVFNGTRPVAIGGGFHNHAVTAFNGGGMRGGFRGGAAAGGGFHGGGFSGGFHGGGFGGGGHGGR
jgi:uncharacterized membrane protein YgcG